MKWPFVRRSLHDSIVSKLIKREIELNDKLYDFDDIKKSLEDQIEIHKKLHDEYAQLNHDNLNEINRLNQELANELNSHRETKEHEQKLFEAHDKLNQQNMGLLFENEKLLKQNNQLIIDKCHLKLKVKRLESLLTKHKLELESAKNHVTWFYGNYARFKDMIEKSGYYKKI